MTQKQNTTQAVTELARIQSELKAPKGQVNSFGKYRYRSQEDILEALKKVKGDCAVTLHDAMTSIGDRIYVEATARLIAPDGSTVSCKGYAREADQKKGMDSAQVTGATSSYARKYALNGLFAIDDTKDSDSETVGEDLDGPASAEQRERIATRCADLEVDLDTFWKFVGCADLVSMHVSHYNKAMKALDRKETQK